jgi:hypothetical protein
VHTTLAAADPQSPPPLHPPRSRAKYTLKHLVRTMLAADDQAFNCVYEKEDEFGIKGVQ